MAEDSTLTKELAAIRSESKTVKEYINSLPEERRLEVGRLRHLIKNNLPPGYAETMNWGMISYEIPLKRYPKTYNNKPLTYVALASQKRYISLYLMNIYGDEKTTEWFHRRYVESGKKLNMGKSCVRFRKVNDLPLDLIAQTIALTSVDEFISYYEKSRRGRG